LVTDLVLGTVASGLALLELRSVTLVIWGDTDVLVLVTDLILGAVASGLALLELGGSVTLVVRSVTSLFDFVTDEALHAVLSGHAVLTHLGECILYGFINEKDNRDNRYLVVLTPRLLWVLGAEQVFLS
jgi:hypothetical protein